MAALNFERSLFLSISLVAILVSINLSLNLLSIEGIITTSTAEKIKGNSLTLQNMTSLLKQTGNATLQQQAVKLNHENQVMLRQILANVIVKH